MVRCVGAIHAAYFLIIVSEKALGGASGKHDIGKCAALIIQGLCISKHRGIASPAFPRCNQMGMKGNGVKIKLLAIFGSMLCTASLLGESFSLAPIGGGEKPALRANDVVKVKGKGVGANKAEALKDAYRDAVERAVGLFVDAEQMIKNDEILKDQVLTQSNAYIEKYDLIKESEADGLVHVDILAVVRKSALVTKVSAIMPVQNAGLGGTLKDAHAKITTIDKRNADGAALLANALEGVDPIRQIMSASIASTKPKITKLADPEKVRLQYPFQVVVDKKRYTENFIPKLKQILDQISLTPPKQIRLLELPTSQEMGFARDDAEYVKNGPKYDYSEAVHDGKRVFGMTLKDGRVFWSGGFGARVTLDFNKIYSSGNNYNNIDRLVLDATPEARHWRKNRGDPKSMLVLLVTDVGPGVSHGAIYTVDGDTAGRILAWQKEVVVGPNSYSIVLKDEKGIELVARQWQIGDKSRHQLFNTGFINLADWPGERTSRYGGSATGGDFFVWLVTPLLRTSAERYVEWLSFDVAKDDLARIASVSVELED